MKKKTEFVNLSMAPNSIIHYDSGKKKRNRIKVIFFFSKGNSKQFERD